MLSKPRFLCIALLRFLIMSMLRFDLEPLKTLFPEGIPRNSFIVVAGEGGSGKSILLSVFAKSILQLGEPVLYLALDDDPKTVVQQLKSLGVDVLEYVKQKLFFIVDGYSFRIRGSEPRLSVSVISKVNPQNIEQVFESLLAIVTDLGIEDRGLIAIDSLNEFLFYYSNDVQSLVEYIKNVRANFSKARNVLTIATLHTSTALAKELLSSIEHCVDGIILTERIQQEPSSSSNVVWRVMVKRMKGVKHNLNWVSYSI